MDELEALALAAKARQRRASNGPNDGSDFFLNPETGQMTSRELMKNRVEPSRTMAAIGGGMQGAGFGFGDEALGAVQGGLDPDARRFYTEQARANLEANQEAYGGIDLAARILGGLPAAVAASPAIVGQGLWAATGLGAATGAAEGALYGLGEGEGSVSDRLPSAGKGAAVGGLVGAAAPGIVRGAGWAAGRIADPIVGLKDAALGRASKSKSNRAIASALQRSGKTADELAKELGEATIEGQGDFVLADALGNPGQRMLSGVTRQPGDYRREIVDFLNKRQGTQGRRIGGFLDEALNDVQNPQNLPIPYGQVSRGNMGQTAKQVAERMTSARGKAADAAYDAARNGAGPVDIRGAVAAIDDRIGPMKGSGVAGDGIDATLDRFRRRLIAEAPTGDQFKGASQVEMSDFNRVLGVKQDVDDAIQVALRAGRNNEARELGKLKSQLDSALEAASEGYRSANDDFARASREIDAIETGRSMRRPSARTQDNINTYRTMTPAQQQAARVGYTDPLMAQIENTAPGVDKSRRLLDDGTMDELGVMARDPDLLKRRIDREATMFETRNSAMMGSRTADNLADQAEANGIGQELLAAGGNAARGSVSGVIGNVARAVAPYATGQNEATRREIARILLSKDPQAALQSALRQAQTDEASRKVIEALMRSSSVKLAQ